MNKTLLSHMAYLQTICRSPLFSFSTLCLLIFAADLPAQHTDGQQAGLRMVSRKVTSDMPHIHGSIYTDNKALSMRSGDFISVDNGESWVEKPITPNFALRLPFGFRRDLVASLFDSRNGRILAVFNSLDLENLDPGIREPPIAQKSYYLRYSVSDDGGGTWKFDKPIVQKGGFTAKNPLPGVFIGKNSIYVGDRGSKPLITHKGKIIVPAQTTIVGQNGELFNPGNGHTYTDAVVLIGSWSKDNRIAWEMSERIIGDPKRSTRGMIEPTVIELKNGHLVMVMRGSNEQKANKNYTLPGYKWLSVSKDGGKSWTKPEPLTFEGGKELFSPSSMSTLFKHSSGRCFWIGNRTPENNKGNLPRWPLVCAELNTKDLKLISSSILVLDTQEETDKPRGRLDISHFSVVEDQKTKEIIITYPRSYNAYKSQEWVTTRVAIK